MYKIYGIWYYGLGFVWSFLQVLEVQQFDCLLIEVLEDVSFVLEYMLYFGLYLLVVIFIYDVKDLWYVFYLFFVEFLFEWQAVQFGLVQGLDVWFMDLFMSMQFQLDEEEQQQLLLFLLDVVWEVLEVCDFMGYMACLAGYWDSECWWEVIFEQFEYDIDIFVIIISLNMALCDEFGWLECFFNCLWEVYMCKQLCKVIKDGFKNIVVVCGVWYIFVLYYFDCFK